jgi:hypothetical protein
MTGNPDLRLLFLYMTCFTLGGGLALRQNLNDDEISKIVTDFDSCGKNRFTHITNPHGTAMNKKEICCRRDPAG